MSRVLALALAVALVVGAVVLRQGRDDEAVDRGPVLDEDAPLAATCPTEWRTLCQSVLPASAVRVDTAAAGVIADGLAGDDPGTAVLPSAWADVVDDARARAGREPLTRSAVLARTPLVVVAFADRAQVLADACAVDVGALGWDCIGEHAGSRWEDLGGDVRWGSVVPGHLPPTSATGLPATAAVIAARTGTPFSLNDLRDVGFTSWFGRVERAVASFQPPGGSYLTAMVTRGPSAANVAMATEADVTTRDLDTAFGPIVLSVPDPRHDVELVVVGVDGVEVDAVADRLDLGGLAGLGWRTTDAPPTGSPLTDLSPATPTPSGGVLTAVRGVWDDVAG